MTGHNFPQPPRLLQRMTMLNTVEKYQHLRQQKQQQQQQRMSIIVPLEGKQMQHLKWNRSCDEKANFIFAINSIQQIHPSEDTVVERNEVDKGTGESSSQQFLTNVEGILQKDLVRFKQATSRFPNIHSKRPKRQEGQDLRTTHLRNIKSRFCSQTSSQTEGTRNSYHNYRHGGGHFSTPSLFVSTQTKAQVSNPAEDQVSNPEVQILNSTNNQVSNNSNNSDSAHTTETANKLHLKSTTSMSNSDMQGNYSNEHLKSLTTNADHERDCLFQADYNGAEVPTNLRSSVQQQLRTRRQTAGEKTRRKSKKELNKICPAYRLTESGTATSSVTYTENEDFSRNNKRASVRILKPLLGNGFYPNIEDDSEEENTDLIVTRLPPIHKNQDINHQSQDINHQSQDMNHQCGQSQDMNHPWDQRQDLNHPWDQSHDLNHLWDQSPNDSPTPPDSREVLQRYTEVPPAEEVDDLQERHLEARSSEYLGQVDQYLTPRRRYKMHIVITIPDFYQCTTSPEPDPFCGTDIVDPVEVTTQVKGNIS